jgi:hypothetical protein
MAAGIISKEMSSTSPLTLQRLSNSSLAGLIVQCTQSFIIQYETQGVSKKASL